MSIERPPRVLDNGINSEESAIAYFRNLLGYPESATLSDMIRDIDEIGKVLIQTGANPREIMTAVLQRAEELKRARQQLAGE